MRRHLMAFQPFPLMVLLLVLIPVAAWAQVAPRPAPETPVGPRGDKADPGQYHCDLAQVHARYGKTPEATVAYAKALEVSESDAMKARILSAWGELLLRNDETAAGREKLEQAMTYVEDKNIKGRMAFSLARAFEQKGNLHSAAGQYRAVLETTDQPWMRESAINRMLMTYRNADKLDALTALQESALKTDPNDATALEVLTAIHSRMEPDMEKALQTAARLAALKPDDVSAQSLLAGLRARAGQVEQAAAVYEKLAELDPKNKTLYYERIASAYLDAENKEKAVEQAARMVEGDGVRSRDWTRYADICMRADANEKAVAAFEKAVESSAFDRERDAMEIRLAEVYRQLNRSEEAIALYRRLSVEAQSPHMRTRAKRALLELDKAKSEENAERGPEE